MTPFLFCSTVCTWFSHSGCFESVWKIITQVESYHIKPFIACYCHFPKEHNEITSLASLDDNNIDNNNKKDSDSHYAKLKSKTFFTSWISVIFFSLWLFFFFSTTYSLFNHRKRNNQEIASQTGFYQPRKLDSGLLFLSKKFNPLDKFQTLSFNWIILIYPFSLSHLPSPQFYSSTKVYKEDKDKSHRSTCVSGFATPFHQL